MTTFDSGRDSLKIHSNPASHVELADRISVMLVEDSPIIREALEEALSLLSSAKFEGFATTANEAVAMLRQRSFDMVVLDIELAQGNGFDVLRNINQVDYPHPLPVIMVLTNHAFADYKRRAEQLGVKYFFDKSMHFDDAIDAIDQEALHLLADRH